LVLSIEQHEFSKEDVNHVDRMKEKGKHTKQIWNKMKILEEG
jgi:hypothetical protein